MDSVTLHEAKAKLSGLVSSVERSGKRMVLTRYGKPVAQLVPMKNRKRTRVHPKLSSVRFRTDPTKPTAEEWEDV